MSNVDPGISSGGSAPPDAPGSGTGVAGTGTALTGTVQTAANDALSALEDLSNQMFDAGEVVIQDALKIVDAAQTAVSGALSAVVAKISGGEAPNLPTIPVADLGGSLTANAQDAASRAVNALETFANHAFDVTEQGLEDALKVVDAAQTRVSDILSKVTHHAAGKLGAPKG